MATTAARKKPALAGTADAQHDETDDDTGGSFTHRRVNAADAPAPATTAPASVFAMGQRAQAETRQPRAKPVRLDPLTVPVLKGVPIPATNGGPGSTPRYLQLAQRMQPGDCVELTKSTAKTLASLARKAGMKMAVRRLPDGKYGVWRTA